MRARVGCARPGLLLWHVYARRGLRIVTSATGRQRARTNALVRREGRIVPHVFHRDGDPIRDSCHQWQEAVKAAGHPGSWFHDLRRSAVRNFERAKISRSVAMKLSGHKTEAVYRRYAIADAAALEEGIAKLARLGPDAQPLARNVR